MKAGEVMTLGEILVRLGLDSRGYNEGLAQAEGSAGKFGGAMKNMSKLVIAGGAAATASIAAIGVKSIRAASDAEEMRGKFSVVFGDLEKETRDWAATSAEAMGRSQIAFEGYLAETQNMLVGMGSTREEGAELSKQIVELGVDLASFNNLAEDNALASLQSAISGNHSASKALGAVLNENTLAMAMERMEIQGKFQDLSEAEKMQVRYNAVLMQSEDAVGDAVRTSDSFANQMRRLKAGIADTVAELGEELLPTATQFVQYVTGALPKAREIMSGVFSTIGRVASEVGEIFDKTVIPAVSKIAEVVMANMPAIQERFRQAFEVAAQVIAVVVDIIQNKVIPAVGAMVEFISDRLPAASEEFTEVFEKIMDIVSDALEIIILLITTFIEQTQEFWEKYGGFITDVTVTLWETLREVFSAALDIISGVLKFFIGLLTGDWEKMSEGLQKIWEGLWRTIKAIVEGAWSLLSSAFNGLKRQIADFWRGLRDEAVTWGRNIMQGLADGIRNMASAPLRAARNVAADVGDTVKGFFGIKSPSKLMEKYGRSISEGLQLGMDRYRVQYPLPNISGAGVGSGGRGSVAAAGAVSYNSHISIQNMVIRDDQDINRIARELYLLQRRQSRGV